MRGAAALALVAAGAILTFAVSAEVPGISLRLTGVIIMLAGAATTLLPPSPVAGWLRRHGRGEAHAGPETAATPADLGSEYPAYLMQDPAVLAAEVLNGIRAESWPQDSRLHEGGPHGGHVSEGRGHGGRPPGGPSRDSWSPDAWPEAAWPGDARPGDGWPGDRWPEDGWLRDRSPQDSWSQPAAAQGGSRPRRPAGQRPLRSVPLDSEDGVG